MLTVGKKCPICKRVHIVKPMNVLENLTPKQRTQTFKAEAEHRLFIDGYYCSLDMDSETWEFYEPLTVWKLSLEKEEEEGEEKKREEPFYGMTEYEKEQLLDEDDYED